MIFFLEGGRGQRAPATNGVNVGNHFVDFRRLLDHLVGFGIDHVLAHKVGKEELGLELLGNGRTETLVNELLNLINQQSAPLALRGKK